MIWWIWVGIGVLLIIGELFFPLDFFLIFIGLGFTVTGVIAYAEIFNADWIEWVLCALFSLLFYAGLKRPLTRHFSKDAVDRREDYIGEVVRIKADIAPGETGSGDLRGTGWQVKNLSGKTLLTNSNHAVARTDGIALVIE